MRSIVVFLLLLFTAITVNAQDARSLIKDGIQLHETKQYAGAIAKYQAALALEPENSTALYQLAVSLNASGKGLEALPYLQKVTAVNDVSETVRSASLALMGSIYDKAAQPQKAISSYLQAIKADIANYQLHYNLSLAYFRNKQYDNAEESALKVLAAEPKHTGSLRVYALVTFHQNKRAPALLALCRYLLLEPAGPSSGEAYGNLQSILKGGVLKAERGAKLVDAANMELNRAITAAVSSVGKAQPVGATLLSKQLTAVFIKVGVLNAKQKSNDAYFNNLAAYFHQLAASDNMLTFANIISQSADKNAAVWVRENGEKVEMIKSGL